jgi:hypothetical protein
MYRNKPVESELKVWAVYGPFVPVGSVIGCDAAPRTELGKELASQHLAQDVFPRKLVNA